MTRPRRDPRAERAALIVATHPRLRLVRGPASLPVRPRIDPRADRAAQTRPGQLRPRLERLRRGTASAFEPRPASAAFAGAPPEPRCIPEPAFLVLVVRAGAGPLTQAERGLLGAARRLADAGGGAVVALAAADPADLAAAGADRVLAPPPTPDGAYASEALAVSVVAASASLNPRHLLFLDERTAGGDVARRVAAKLGERPQAGVVDLTAARATRRAGQGPTGAAQEMTAPPARILTLAAAALAPHAGPPHEALPLTLPFPLGPPPRVTLTATLAADPDRVPLGEALLVLAAGNGLTDLATFGQAAAVLGAVKGASRVLCDRGLLPRDRQVGASGTVVRARAYLALGIAGAPQHLQGITEVEHVLAVNTDLHAAMVKRADLAIVADAAAVLPALLRLARAGPVNR